MVLCGQTVDSKGPYARNLNDWRTRFVRMLTTQARIPAANIRVLAESADAKANPAALPATQENVKAAFTALRTGLRPSDQFVLIILGHGTVTDPVGKLCLPGEDLKASALAEMLDALPTRRVVVINCASGGGELLEKIAAPGRIVVSAAGNAGEGNQTYFAEFFLAACETSKADRNGDGLVTVVEAFNRAAHDCMNWYHRQYKIPAPKDAPPGPRKVEVRTAEARRLFKKFYTGIDDLVMVTPDADEDENVNPPGGENIEDLQLRREAGEHASLEDRGETTGASHWVGSKHCDLEGKPGEQGELAARTVLGSPKLLPKTR